jgi:hypothetical protein
MAVLARATGAHRMAAAVFGAVAGGVIAAFHLAWQFDVGGVATSSSRLDAGLQPAGRLDAVADTGGPAWMGRSPVVVSHGEEFLVFQGGGGYGAVRLRRLDGTVLWDFAAATGERPNEAIAVPPRAGRALRYVVGARSGTYGYDATFALLWHTRVDAARVSAAEAGGVLTLVVQRDKGAVVLLDEEGRIMDELPARPRLSFVHVVAWPDEVVMVAGRKDRLAVLDLAGNVMHEWKLMPVGRSPVVATARFGVMGDPHLAVLTESSSGIGRAVLTVIDSTGAVVHREVVEMTGGLHTVRRPTGDVLLFGDGRHRVWALDAGMQSAVRTQPAMRTQ